MGHPSAIGGAVRSGGGESLLRLAAGRHWRAASEKRDLGAINANEQAGFPFRQFATQAVRKLCRHFSLAGCQWRPAMCFKLI